MPIVMDTLRYFYGATSRWPTNFAELKKFAGREKLPLGTNNYEDAVFTTDSEGGLSMNYRNGTGHMSMGKGGPALIRAHNDLVEQMSNSNARLATSKLRSLARSEETSTFTFILNNFRDEYGYWPTNVAPLLAFAKKDKQAAVPEGFLDASFAVLPDGGIQIVSSSNGTLRIGGSLLPASGSYPGSVMIRRDPAVVSPLNADLAAPARHRWPRQLPPALLGQYVSWFFAGVANQSFATCRVP